MSGFASSSSASGGGEDKSVSRGHASLHKYPGILHAFFSGFNQNNGYSNDNEDSSSGEETPIEIENADESIVITYVSDRTRSKTAKTNVESNNTLDKSSTVKNSNNSVAKSKKSSKRSDSQNLKKQVKISRPKKQRITLIPGTGYHASGESVKCHSTNYLELLTAFYFCFKIKTYDEMLSAFDSVLEDAQKNLETKGKYKYGNEIIFSNAKRAINHCENFKKNVETNALFQRQVDNTLLVLHENILKEFGEIPDVINAYIGYIPLETQKSDAEPEKFQNPTDVCLILRSREILNISCKATTDCPLTNWWWVNYLHHCGFRDESNFFQTLMDARIASVEIDKTIDFNGKSHKDILREQWNTEDKQIGQNDREPVFSENTPMWHIQRVMKTYGNVIILNAMSDIFTQTVYYPVYLFAGGNDPLFLNLSNHSPDSDNITINFKHPSATSGKNAKFIFGVTCDFDDITFNFKVEIRRSGEIHNYRIHFILENIVEKLRRGGSRKRKSLRRRKTRRRK
jgi:hypothetical protein